jgi:hypothetical protein
MNKRIENFLTKVGLAPAKSNSRNPLESPWALDEKDFIKRAKKYGTPDVSTFKSARGETMSLTEEAVRVEGEIDEMVRSLYGV